MRFIDVADMDLFGRYAEAMRLFAERRWSAARSAFAALSDDYPKDGPTATMLNRATQLQDMPPPPQWDGVWDDLGGQSAAQSASLRSSALRR
ncbi:hypothetical protein [Sphingomonas sp. ID1715]|uniref:hypothetical protein n=1 Tax=Sphingomonas sp. ID1715 TaxID=1656898 RepID=UPI0020C51029|nr:hypothetical protein [Sphingomonas sp. ID1715]